ncbi:hypothetical protein K501DRAFT_265815 [Backusella circina FSU 941]|nr:hypothetical protein K501DRAFT_265815 [Backusella circina FSU 941]
MAHSEHYMNGFKGFIILCRVIADYWSRRAVTPATIEMGDPNQEQVEENRPQRTVSEEGDNTPREPSVDEQEPMVIDLSDDSISEYAESDNQVSTPEYAGSDYQDATPGNVRSDNQEASLEHSENDNQRTTPEYVESGKQSVSPPPRDRNVENQSETNREFFELFFSCSLDKYSPFYNVDMKKLIQTLVRESEPATFQLIISLLPNNGKVQELGHAFFDDANTDFWMTVSRWEKKLRDGDFKVPTSEPPELPYKDEAYLEYWNARVNHLADSRAKKELKRCQSNRVKILNLYGKRNKVVKRQKKRVTRQLR